MAQPPPALMDELVEEILLRIPPYDTASLMRAALVCKHWCRLVSSPGFRRRFRERHRRPPMLGVLRNFAKKGDLVTAHFIPACSFRPRRADHRGWRALDSRHGRVLLHKAPTRSGDVGALAVWEPVTDEQRQLPSFPFKEGWKAIVLCAAAAAGECDHIICHRGPFLVAVLGICREGISVYVYSSESDAWSEPASAERNVHRFERMRGAHVGNALYFMCSYFRGYSSVKKVLKYDLGTREITTIDPPPMSNRKVVLMTAEGGGLGSAMVTASILLLWSRNAGPDGDMRWTQNKVIELKPLIPIYYLAIITLDVVSFADGNGVLYIGTNSGSFSADLKSGLVRKVRRVSSVEDVIPYVGFYTPAALEMGSTGEGPRAGASSA